MTSQPPPTPAQRRTEVATDRDPLHRPRNAKEYARHVHRRPSHQEVPRQRARTGSTGDHTTPRRRTSPVAQEQERPGHVFRRGHDAATKITAAELQQATALRTIKDRGETVASIAEATELSAAEVRGLLKPVPASSTPSYEPTTAKLDPEDLPPAAQVG